MWPQKCGNQKQGNEILCACSNLNTWKVKLWNQYGLLFFSKNEFKHFLVVVSSDRSSLRYTVPWVTCRQLFKFSLSPLSLSMILSMNSWGNLGEHSRSTLEPLWDHSRTTVGPHWDHSGITLGSSDITLWKSLFNQILTCQPVWHGCAGC